MKIDLIFDILIICLLFPTIIYAVILNHRLKSLRSNQEDFAKLILAFNDATTRAESGTIKLRQLAEHAGSELKGQVDTAKVLREDLAYFLEKAESVSSKLETSIRQGQAEIQNIETRKRAPIFMDEIAEIRPMPKKEMTAPRKKIKTYADEDDFLDLDENRSEAERELLKALQAIG